MKHRPHGIWPILYAFFDADDRLDRDVMRRQIDIVVKGGAHGMAVLGLATEVAKLSSAERRQIVEWCGKDLAGRLPLAVTIFGNTLQEQKYTVGHAAGCGAAWVILQPPRVTGISEADLIRFFGAIIKASPVPVAIQNAPEYIGIGLSPAGLLKLHRRHENFIGLKAEAPATQIADLVENFAHPFAIFNGRGGLELPDILRAGAAGMIPAPDCFDTQVKIYEAMQRGEEAEAERLYREILPATVFAMQSIPHLICYGKRIAAKRMGVAVHDRLPRLAPNALGLAAVDRFAAALGPYAE